MAASMKDIARKTDLGLATISKYFNGSQVRTQNRKLIFMAAEEMHFIPNGVARSQRTNQSRSIGIVIPELSNTFITSIISGIEIFCATMIIQQSYVTAEATFNLKRRRLPSMCTSESMY